MLAQATGDADPVLVLGGVLHDCLEDGGTTYDELAMQFGQEVADLVAEVTDPESANEEERRRHQVEATPALSEHARLLKIADKASNLREIADDPPPGWSRDEIRAYVQWGADVVAGCRGINWALESAFDAAHAQALDSVGDH
jgi:guanosine-3',5'-bis(diphosphate) 3'-pyrophosphohydrolase